MGRLLETMKRAEPQGRFVAAVGPSGAGKSSVVRAGLVPALRSGAITGSAEWFIATMLPGPRPYEELEAALNRVATSPVGSLADQMAGNERGILRAIGQVLPDETSELVLVIDQFEELFTLVDTPEREAFLAGVITAVTEPRSRLRVVITIRADFWDRPLAHPELSQLLETAAVTVGPLTAEELERAVVEPVRVQGIDYEAGLAARVMADVAGQPGALPLLQYALTDLFERRADGVIPASAYDEMGGIAGALATRAEETFAGLTEPQQSALRRMFGRLVTLGEGTEDTRRRVGLTEVGVDDDTTTAVDAFGNARLLAFDRDPSTREPTVEIAHEALLQAWHRVRSWIDEDRDQLRTHRRLTIAADEWNRGGRDDDELYRGARLESAVELVDHGADRLNELESAFVSASQHNAEAEAKRRHRRTRVLQGLLSAAAVLLVAALIATAVAVNRTQDAANERDAAQAAEALAQEQRDAADALSRDLQLELFSRTIIDLVADGRPPVTAALLAAELYNLDPSPRSLDVVAQTLLSTEGWLGTLPGWWIGSTPAGRIITIEDERVIVRENDLTPISEIPIQPFGSDTSTRAMALHSNDGRYIIVDQPDGPSVIDLESGEVSAPIDIEMGPPAFGFPPWAWTHTSESFVVVSAAGDLHLFGVDGVDLTELTQIEDDIQLPALTFHPDEPRLVVVDTATADVRVYDSSELASGALTLLNGFSFFDPDAMGSAVPGLEGGWSYFALGEIFYLGLDGTLGRVDNLGPTTGFRNIAWQVGPNTLFTGTRGTDASLVDLTTGEVIGGPWASADAAGYDRYVEVLGGDVAALRATDNTIHLWSRVGGNPLGTTLPPLPAPPGEAIAALPDDRVAIDRTLDSAARFGLEVWSWANGQAVTVELGVTDPWDVTLNTTAEGPLAIVVDVNGTTTVHELPSGRRVGPSFELGAAGTAGAIAQITADRRLLVAQVLDGIRIFDFETGAELAAVDHGGGEPQNRMIMDDEIATAADGEFVAVVDLDTLDTIFVGNGWPLDVSRSRGGFIGHTFADDSLSTDLYDFETGEITWTGREPLITSFDPSENFVFNWGGGQAGEAAVVQFFDFESGEPVGPVVEGPSVWEEEVLTQVRAGRAHVWNTDPTSWPDIACEVAGRNLTRTEWETFLPAVEYAPSCSQWPVDS